MLPNNKSHLFNTKTYDSVLSIPNKTSVNAKNATLADGLSTAYAVSDELNRKNLVKVFSKEKFIIT